MNRGEERTRCTVPRRCIFPSYEATLRAQKSVAFLPNDAKKHVRFSPTARVLIVEGRQDMSFAQKSLVWFQDTDYKRFEKSVQIVVNAGLKRGDEVWLTSDTSRWGNPHNRNQRKNAEMRNKWWCMFGHSRRGLEHIVSKKEGLQRQRNVNKVVKAVLDEQSRQRVNRIYDPVKLADVSLKYTLWAKNLALADAAADNDAVQSNFGIDTKSRVYYWNMISKQVSLSSSEPVHAFRGIEEVIIPSSNEICFDFLDTYTSSTLTFQQQQMFGLRSKYFRILFEEVAEMQDFIADEENKPHIPPIKTFAQNPLKKPPKYQACGKNVRQGDLLSTTLSALSKISMTSWLLWSECHEEEEEICSFI